MNQEELIDPSLPEYIHQLMGQQEAPTSANSHHQHFHNHPKTIFQYVDKTDDLVIPLAGMPVDAASTRRVVSEVNEDASIESKHAPVFMSLNSEFRHLSTETSNSLVDTTSQFPALSLPDVNEVKMLQGKALPHKKRISRKLKVDMTGKQSLSPVNKLETMQDQLSHNGLPSSSMQFNCELCGHSTVSQLQFFTHLKLHYEPIFAPMKDPQNEIEESQKQHDGDMLPCSFDNENKGQKCGTGVELQGVHLTFDDFPQVEQSVRESIHATNTNGVKNAIDNFGATREPLNDEVEFSENEDMLEGIRGVVDKVSIEDTCDDIELISSSAMRAPWFSSDSFSNTIFKNKVFADLSFGGAVSQLPETIVESCELPPVYKEHNKTLLVDYNKSKSIDIISLEHTDEANKNLFVDDYQATIATVPPEPFLEASNLNNSNDRFISDVDINSYSSQSDIDNTHKGQTPLATTNSTATKRNGRMQKDYICTKCDRNFNSSNALKYHKRTHSGVRPYKCAICERSFFAQSALKSHENTHNGQRPFKCQLCHRSFRQWGDLKYHTVSIHSNDKSHQCEYCGKAFARKYSLVVHRRIHTSERNYKCDYCEKTFRASTYLHNHRKIHTGEKPHECSICSKRFRMSGDMRRHMRIHVKLLEPKGLQTVIVEGHLKANDQKAC